MNAFAAMFLAPEPAVRAAFGPPRKEGLGLAEAERLSLEAAALFGMGFPAAAWHLHNLGYMASDDTVRALLRERPAAPAVGGFESESGFDGLDRLVYVALKKDAISRAAARRFLGGEPSADAVA